MNRLAAECLDRAVFRLINRPHRFDPPRPLREPVPGGLLEHLLKVPVAALELPPGKARRPLPLDYPSPAPVGDGSPDRLTGFLIRPRDEPARAVLLVPGWLAGFRPYFRCLAGRAAARGALVAFLDLPAHFRRAPPGSRSGDRFFTGDLWLTGAYLRQAVAEARSLLRALAAEVEGRPVVAWGLSLGAWVAGHAAAEEPPCGALLLTPAADLVGILEHTPLLPEMRRALERSGNADLKAIRALAAGTALRERPAPAGGVHIVGGRHDRLVPVAMLQDLAEAWGTPLDLRPAGHISPYLSPRLLGSLLELLEGWPAPSSAGSSGLDCRVRR